MIFKVVPRQAEVKCCCGMKFGDTDTCCFLIPRGVEVSLDDNMGRVNLCSLHVYYFLI